MLLVVAERGIEVNSQWNAFYPDKYMNPSTDTDETLYMRIRRACKLYADRTAIEYGAKKYTYSALLAKIDDVASRWKKVGIVPGDRVLLMMGNNPMNAITVYALDKLGATGAISIPVLSTEDFETYANAIGAKYCVMSCNQYWNYAPVLKNTPIKTVVIGKYKDLISGIDKLILPFYPLSAYDTPKPQYVPEGIKLIYWRDVKNLILDLSEQSFEDYDRDNNRTALYLFASEAGDKVEAVGFSGRTLNVAANIVEMAIKANEDATGKPARMLCLNESCFTFGFVIGIHSVLSFGQNALFFSWFKHDRLFFAIKHYKPDVLIGYNNSVANINRAGLTSDILKSVDRIIVSGGLLTSNQKASLFEIAKSSGRKLSVCSIFGCDEIFAYVYGPSDLQSDRLLGFPFPGIMMRIADRETGLDVPEGTEGEIAVCTPIPATMFTNDELLNRKNYKKSPDGRIWYFTGNIGKQDENKMFYLIGSKHREVRINSYPVYPAKVDGAVQLTEGVVESCTLIIDRAEGPILVTAVVPEGEYLFDNSMMENLRDHITSECELMLPEAMRPSSIMFFASFPRNPKGTTDYEALKVRVELLLEEEISDEAITEEMLRDAQT